MSRIADHPERCACARCPRPPDRKPDVTPGTLEHDIWRQTQDAKQWTYEAKFAARSREIGRPEHWR